MKTRRNPNHRFGPTPSPHTVAAQRTPTTTNTATPTTTTQPKCTLCNPNVGVCGRARTPHQGCESWHHRPRRCVTGPSPRPARQGTWHSETPTGVSSADPAAPGDESGTFQPQPTRHQAQHTPMKPTFAHRQKQASLGGSKPRVGKGAKVPNPNHQPNKGTQRQPQKGCWVSLLVVVRIVVCDAGCGAGRIVWVLVLVVGLSWCVAVLARGWPGGWPGLGYTCVVCVGVRPVVRFVVLGVPRTDLRPVVGLAFPQCVSPAETGPGCVRVSSVGCEVSWLE